MGDVMFVDRKGECRYGKIIRMYGAYEGDVRYIIHDETNGRDYRCTKVNSEYKELVI